MIVAIQIVSCVITLIIFLCIICSGIAHHRRLVQGRKRAKQQFDDIANRARNILKIDDSR